MTCSVCHHGAAASQGPGAGGRVRRCVCGFPPLPVSPHPRRKPPLEGTCELGQCRMQPGTGDREGEAPPSYGMRAAGEARFHPCILHLLTQTRTSVLGLRLRLPTSLPDRSMLLPDPGSLVLPAPCSLLLPDPGSLLLPDPGSLLRPVPWSSGAPCISPGSAMPPYSRSAHVYMPVLHTPLGRSLLKCRLPMLLPA